MLLTYNELIDLVDSGAIEGVPRESITHPRRKGMVVARRDNREE